MKLFSRILSVLGVLNAGSAAQANETIVLPKTYDELLEAGYNYVSSLQSAHEATWKMSEAANYEVDLMSGEIWWFFPEKTVSAPAELLGTWNPKDGTFLWGWDHPSAPEGSAVASAALKAHADTHGISDLQDSKVECDFEECWSLVSAAGLVGQLQGIYRFETSPGGAWAYIGFGGIAINANK